VTSYAVSCVPEDHVDAYHFTLKVEYRPGGRWVLMGGSRFLSRTDTWSRGYYWTEQDFAGAKAGREAWLAEHWHDENTALELARKHAPLMTVNGYTVASVLARIEAKETSR
jgi:hypothetical protein